MAALVVLLEEGQPEEEGEEVVPGRRGPWSRRPVPQRQMIGPLRRP